MIPVYHVTEKGRHLAFYFIKKVNSGELITCENVRMPNNEIPHINSQVICGTCGNPPEKISY